MWNGRLNLATTADECLVSCLLQMAKDETNPVLEVIDIPVVENKKYPSDLLNFNQLGWRAYYHCHPASRAGNHRFKGEHGHFHIFLRLKEKLSDEEEWSHLVALAMDNMGQPLGWFTVNHWVTGEKWLDADVLSKHLEKIPYDKFEDITSSKTTLVEVWLLSLLAMSRDKVKDVLFARDNKLKQLYSDRTGVDVKQSKDIYLLSEQSINLMNLLNKSQN